MCQKVLFETQTSIMDCRRQKAVNSKGYKKDNHVLMCLMSFIADTIYIALCLVCLQYILSTMYFIVFGVFNIPIFTFVIFSNEAYVILWQRLY